LEVDLPDLDSLLQGRGDLGLHLTMLGAVEDLEAGVVVEEADQQDRALVGLEAASQLADVLDEPVGRGERGLRPGSDVVAEDDLEVLQRGLDLDVGVVVDEEVEPRLPEELFAADGVGGDDVREEPVGQRRFDAAVGRVLVDPDPGG
jgi:hypothetical protein